MTEFLSLIESVFKWDNYCISANLIANNFKVPLFCIHKGTKVVQLEKSKISKCLAVSKMSCMGRTELIRCTPRRRDNRQLWGDMIAVFKYKEDLNEEKGKSQTSRWKLRQIFVLYIKVPIPQYSMLHEVRLQ